MTNASWANAKPRLKQRDFHSTRMSFQSNSSAWDGPSLGSLSTAQHSRSALALELSTGNLSTADLRWRWDVLRWAALALGCAEACWRWRCAALGERCAGLRWRWAALALALAALALAGAGAGLR